MSGRLTRLLVAAGMAAFLALSVWLVVSVGARDGLMKRFVSEDDAAHGGTITVRLVPPMVSGAAPQAAAAGIVGSPARPGSASLGRPPRTQPREEPTPARIPERPVREPASGASDPLPAEGASAPPQPASVASDPDREGDAPAPSRPPEVSQAGGQSAYDMVIASRPSMSQAAASGRTTWRVLKDEGGVIWLDIVVNEKSDQHYIWEVEVEKRAVRPLSAAARNLGS